MSHEKQSFASDQEVRWCPGCGDYAILNAVQKFLPELDIPRENMVFISGIGCSGRFPYYLNTYGFHTIHGRAPAVATGLKIARPELSVWIVTGDGDGLSIGGNHLLHILRRNLDVTILLFNNRIYGLTKGQYSPTSEIGKVTTTSPLGTVDQPLDPIRIALAAGATFVARALDVDVKGLQQVLRAANAHRGTSFVEIYQNCNIFNDGAFAAFGEKAVRAERTVWLEHGKPIQFGKNGEKGIRLKGWQPEVVEFDPATPPSDLLIHDSYQETPILAEILSQMVYPQLPVPFGILRAVRRPTFEELHAEQHQKAKTKHPQLNLMAALQQGQTWEVKA